MSQIEVKAVDSKHEFKTFLRVPWTVYAGDPNWVPPLFFERKQALASDHPYFEHARWQAWVAYLDEKPVGRITAQVDALFIERHQVQTGFFGFPEAVDHPGVFAALFEAAESWLREQGMTRAAGPFNLGINQEVGLLVEGFDTPPYIMMGHGRSYFAQAVEAQGYSKAIDTLAYVVNCDAPVPPAIRRLYDRALRRVSIRPLNRKRMDQDLELMRAVFNDAWDANWGFVPFTENEFNAIGKELLMWVPDAFIQITELDGEPVAFAAMIPNINEAIADLNGRLWPFGWAKLLWRLKVRYPRSARVPLMGVRSRFHQSHMGAVLAYITFFGMQQPALDKGVKSVEMSWILENNKGMRSMAESLGGVITKRYRMYEKALVAVEE